MSQIHTKLDSRRNNFDFLRFLFALFVVMSHSYSLSGDNESNQWIYKITNGQIVLARLGLDGFFIISGFFIYKSLEHSTGIFNYFQKRCLRLFPALFIVLLLTLIFVPIVYSNSIPFLKNKEVLTYLPNNLSLYGFQPIISGVFDNNPYHSINGSLWTIRYEFSLYIALSLLYFFKQNKTVVKLLLMLCLVGLLIIFNFYLKRFSGSSFLGMNGYQMLDLGTFFVCGSLLASLNFEKIKRKEIVLIVAVLIAVASLGLNVYTHIKHVILPIIIVLIGFIQLPVLSNFGKIGDMSYGIYIYSFPVQQTLMYIYKLNVMQLMFWSVIISILFGYLSWHLIEKRALKYKNYTLIKYNN